MFDSDKQVEIRKLIFPPVILVHGWYHGYSVWLAPMLASRVYSTPRGSYGQSRARQPGTFLLIEAPIHHDFDSMQDIWPHLTPNQQDDLAAPSARISGTTKNHSRIATMLHRPLGFPHTAGLFLEGGQSPFDVETLRSNLNHLTQAIESGL